MATRVYTSSALVGDARIACGVAELNGLTGLFLRCAVPSHVAREYGLELSRFADLSGEEKLEILMEWLLEARVLEDWVLGDALLQATWEQEVLEAEIDSEAVGRRPEPDAS